MPGRNQVLLLRIFFTACSVLAGSLLYVLLLLQRDNFDPAIIGPMLGFTFGAALVIFTLWWPPGGVRRAYAREPRDWLTASLAVWAFVAPYAAGFMVWVATLSLLASFIWAVGMHFQGTGAAAVALACFIAAQVFVARTWQLAISEPTARR